MKAALLLCLMACPALAQEVAAIAPDPAPPEAAEVIAVPSRQVITLQDVILNEQGAFGLTARFRFTAPGIAPDGGVTFDASVADMQHLCDTYALPRIANTGPLPQQIIISLSAAPLPFGDAAPEITQFFEAYSVQDNVCIWEVF